VNLAEPESYRVQITHTAKRMLRKIGRRNGTKVYGILRDQILDLEFNPKQKGRALRAPLEGLYSRHHSRYRIIYAVRDDVALVVAVAVGYRREGERQDIYAIVERLVNAGAIAPELLERGD
jgi:mRNA interferase RelE/StbE